MLSPHLSIPPPPLLHQFVVTKVGQNKNSVFTTPDIYISVKKKARQIVQKN